MATYPAIEPTTREYDFGTFPMSEAKTFSGSGVRFNHGDEPTDQALTLGYEDLLEAQLAQLRAHYAGQGGGVVSFALPAVVWQGHGAIDDVALATDRWIYAEPLEEDPAPGGLYNLAVRLRNVGAE
jgi:hypothetical protein